MTRFLQKAYAYLCVLLFAAGIVGCGPAVSEPPPSDEAAFEPGPMVFRAIEPLPQPVVADPLKAALGRTLFNDVRLSRNDTLSCASCHDLRAGGDDGRRVPIGVDGQKGTVNTPTVLNSVFNFAQFWDGRARTLEEQIEATVRSQIEMDGDWATIVRKLGADASMAARFAAVYEGPVTKRRVIDALAAYLSVLVTWDSPLDRYLRGDESALDEEQRAGYQLFMDFGCVSCHQGRNVGANLFQHFGVMGDYFSDRGAPTEADYGRFKVTGREEDRYKFKVPSLRNVAETAPYFHDGSAGTLEDAVRIMVQYQLGRHAEERDVRLLVAFLNALSGGIDEQWL